MTTMLETLAAGAQHDPDILVPNTWYDLLHTVRALCPCGAVTSVRDGRFGTHEPKSTWDMDGQRRPAIAEATGIGWTCRYSDRTVTLAAALERDSALTDAEKYVRDTTQRRLEAGIAYTAPAGFALPKPLADLFALAEANGWQTAQAWGPRDAGFVLNVRVGRPAGDGRRWSYDLSYFVGPRAARRTPFGLSVTPDRPAPHDTPSLKAIRAVVAANPVSREARNEG